MDWSPAIRTGSGLEIWPAKQLSLLKASAPWSKWVSYRYQHESKSDMKTRSVAWVFAAGTLRSCVQISLHSYVMFYSVYEGLVAGPPTSPGVLPNVQKFINAGNQGSELDITPTLAQKNPFRIFQSPFIRAQNCCKSVEMYKTELPQIKIQNYKMRPGGASLDPRALWYNFGVNLTHVGPWARFLLVKAQAHTHTHVWYTSSLSRGETAVC